MTRPLKIAIASSGLGHVTRGIESWAADLAAGLSARGENVVLYKGGGAAEVRYERVLGCWRRSEKRTERVVHWLARGGWRLGVGSAYGVEQTTFVAAVIRQLRRDQIDVLHVQDPQVGLIAQRASQVGLTRTVVVVGHGTEEAGEFLSKIQYLQHLSPWQLEEWRRIGIHRSTWTAIPNFVDTDTFRLGGSAAMRAELGIPADALVVLSAAAIKRDHKRIDHLVNEFARLRVAAPELPVWLVVAGGRERDTDELVRHGRELLGNRVRFLVQFPRTRMPELYRAADVFALCSLREMMPIALIEATSSGLPCLVHDHPVLTWITGRSGVVDMETPGELAGRLLAVLASAAARSALGQENRARVEELFSSDRVLSQLIGYYKACLSDRRSGHSRRVVGARTSN
jgi:1,2-diacylglycerol 3-alpha-glucosyltransferase